MLYRAIKYRRTQTVLALRGINIFLFLIAILHEKQKTHIPLFYLLLPYQTFITFFQIIEQLFLCVFVYIAIQFRVIMKCFSRVSNLIQSILLQT